MIPEPGRHFGAEDARRHHRRQRQRDDAGDRDRAGKRERELREKRAGEAALETDGNVDGDQHNGHRYDRPPELTRGDERRLKRRLVFLLHVPIDILDNDDRIVDDEPDREHECEQRQEVDRVTEEQHHEEGADQGQGHRDQRDRDCAEAAEEEKDHDADDQEREPQRLLDLLDRAADELGAVVDNLAVDAARHRGLDLGEHVADTLRDIEHVRVRGDLDADEHRVASAERSREVVVLGAEGDVGDVFEPDDGSILLLD